MKTVAISTVSKDFLLTNYGSFFQHYALRKVLRDLGCCPFRVRVGSERSSYSEMLIDSTMLPLRFLYWSFRRLENRKKLKVLFSSRNKAFWLFRKEYERLIGELDEKQQYDSDTLGVLGGDQVLCVKSDSDLWLHNVKDTNACITYGVSTDWHKNQRDEHWVREISSELQRFTAIGIRENCGVAVVRQLFGNEKKAIRHVADPVQLLALNDYKAIQGKRQIFKNKTLFCYLVNISTQADLHLEVYEELANRLGCELRILGIQGTEMFVPKKYRVLFSPTDFLRALDDSAFFITNSYHGSVFALIYHKKFLSCKQNCPAGSNQNNRQNELMTAFNMLDCYVDLNSPLDAWSKLVSHGCDFSVLDKIQDSIRAESLQWLRSVFV